jgi:magnesium-transporting ATPase (P-type)
MGIIQESRAEASLAALKKMAAPEAQVLRGGHRIMVPSRELVPATLSSSKQATLFQPTFASWMPSI